MRSASIASTSRRCRGPDLAAEPRLAARRRSSSARGRASACSTSAQRRAARRRMLASGEVVAVEMQPGRARELEAELPPARRGECACRRTPTRSSCRPISASSTGCSWTRRARASACSPRRPDLRWRGKPLPELQRELLRAAAERVRPGGTIVYSVCTLNAEENEAVVDASGLDSGVAGERMAAVPAPAPAGVPAHAARRDRDVGLLHRPPKIEPHHELARLDPDGRGGAVAVRGRLLAPRRPDRGAAPRRGARLPLRVGDGHFVPPITIGPIVLQSIPPIVHAAGGVLDCHLMIEAPERHFEQFREAGADSVTVHYEACPDLRRVVALAREQGSRSAWPSIPRRAPRRLQRRRSAEVDFVLCMSIHPGFSGQQFMPEALDRIRALRGLLPATCRPGRRRRRAGQHPRRFTMRAPTCSSAGTSIFGREDLPRAYRRLVGR